MADLCAVFDEVGFPGAKSLLQSGNVVFDAGARDTKKLEKLLEDATAKTLGVETTYIVRTAAEWKRLVAANPFTREAKEDPARLVAFVLKTEPPKGAEQALNSAVKGREVGRVVGACAYIHYPDGQGRSKLTTAVIEKTLGRPGTARNWNTVLKVFSLLGGGDAAA